MGPKSRDTAPLSLYLETKWSTIKINVCSYLIRHKSLPYFFPFAAELDSGVSMTPRSFLHMQISPWNRNHLRKHENTIYQIGKNHRKKRGETPSWHCTINQAGRLGSLVFSLLSSGIILKISMKHEPYIQIHVHFFHLAQFLLLSRVRITYNRT